MKLLLGTLFAGLVFGAQATAATYWNFFEEDPTDFTQIASVNFTYDTAEDMLANTNTQDSAFLFGKARTLSASGSDGTTYWNYFQEDPSDFTQIAGVYFTYNSLEDMLTDTNRQDRYNLFGKARTLTASGSDGTTYWNYFQEDPSDFTQIAGVYYTYNTLEDMLTDTNRQDRHFLFGKARTLTASGSDGTTYWNYFQEDPSDFTQIAGVYYNYNTLEDMLTDTNRQGRNFLLGKERTLGASGATILKTDDPVTPIPVPATLPLLLGALCLLATPHTRVGRASARQCHSSMSSTSV